MRKGGGVAKEEYCGDCGHVKCHHENGTGPCSKSFHV